MATDEETDALIWISGASSGIGKSLIDSRPWPHARVIGISRRPFPGIEHIEADLADPAAWEQVADSFVRNVATFTGSKLIFVHAAGTIEPIGFVEEVDDTASYTASVLLNSAAPQVLGHLFLRATQNFGGFRCFVGLTSGAARTVYPGWAAYGSGKAAVDQWTRDVGAEQSIRGGARIIAISPGSVDTEMQTRIRESAERDFPSRERFVELYRTGKLATDHDVAKRIWELIGQDELESGSVVDLRDLPRA